MQLAPKLKSGAVPSTQQFSLTAEAGVPADMISAYLPHREQHGGDHSAPAGIFLSTMEGAYVAAVGITLSYRSCDLWRQITSW